MLATLDTPAHVVSDLGVTLRQNLLGEALLGRSTGLTGLRRSVFYRRFTEPAERERWHPDDHDLHSRSYAAALRHAHGRAGDAESQALVDALLRDSPEFAALWPRHEVGTRADTRKRLVHPLVGDLTLDCQILTAENQVERLVVFTALPGSEDADRLRLLGVVGAQDFGRPTVEGGGQ